jgi:arylsulfatase A-like enzyme
LLVVGAFAGAGTPVSADDSELPSQPNIVMIYLDDVAPVDALWNDPTRTPNIYENFIAHGIHLDHAIGETPLCCPSRANLLTGLHTHNTRVVRNEAQLFDPSETIGKAMLDAGYASMFIGKYLNRDNSLTDEQWAAHDANWTDLDVIDGVNGAFYNFDLHTKDGVQRIKGVHSTKMVADRAVAHFQETPASTPIFAVLSLYDLHSPNSRQPEDRGDPRCANMPPWDPPNYNEADVSDKPSAIQNLPPQPYAEGWPMVTYCEEMLGVDRAVGQLTAELAAEGRLDNTLLVFAADNGMTWGQHRLGQQKSWPYATPIPLYVRWPAAHWGDTPGAKSEITSDIDFAPTFCELAGPSCVLGPFNRGSDGPDGVSLVPLLNGDVANLGRAAVLEESFASPDNSWSGLRTTSVFDADHRWHYVEYTNGERELYDLVNDPWELQNLASKHTHDALMSTLHDLLAQLQVEGIGDGTGTIIVREDAVPDTGTDYPFSGDLGSFTVDDDGGTNAKYSNEKVFSNLPAGKYAITRPEFLPWAYSGAQCEGVGVSSNATGKVVIYLHPTETVTCTWIDALRQPDLFVSLTKTGTYKKDNLYKSTPVKAQTVKRTGVAAGKTYDYYLKIQNDSGAADTLLLGATTTGPASVSVKFIFGDDQTADVMAGTYEAGLDPGGMQTFHIRVTVAKGTPRGSPFKIVLTARSASDPSKVDVVKIVTVR